MSTDPGMNANEREYTALLMLESISYMFFDNTYFDNAC